MSTTQFRASSGVAVAALGERLGALRLREPESLRAMHRSLVGHGQMTAVTVFADASGQLQLVDGFKRLHVARELGWTALQACTLALTDAQAKVAMQALNRQAGLCELEEAWLVRSLYRDDGLTQPQIGQLIGRHKSWVCRRLMLVESLDEALQGDVRLGLLTSRVGVTLARLPRGNQRTTAAVVTQRGLTSRQVERLCASLLAAPVEAREPLLADWAAGRVGARSASAPRPAPAPAVALMADITQLVRVTGRLQARLLDRPLVALSPEAAAPVRSALLGLGALLDALQQTVARVSATEVSS